MASTNQGGKQGAAGLGGIRGGPQGSPNRGFVSMDPERQREAADDGSKAGAAKRTGALPSQSRADDRNAASARTPGTSAPRRSR